ncbi:ABC transporter ATP-binding protein [Novosphingobium colocasiae]|uniref:ABC transporter n=1 Tax=Novosphingobium colocasiae TaxID=1256513 RepID=A0A918PHC7_9SPHN|nr:ABC transporter ATP-binding protein [Novosphingobium colocasiae]GGZ09724.1 ABC transporter [Novosphingobium colocasiae]
MTLSAQDVTLAGRLSGVSLSLRSGELTAICGPNGAGKSSLLACLAGLTAPEAGTVLLDDGKLAAIPGAMRARRIGYLPQSPQIAWDISVEVLVSLGRLPWPDAPSETARAAIEAALSAMDMGHLRHRPVSRLSGGERARTLMARVLATRPDWLLADEPLASLDLAHASGLIRCFRDQAKAGHGVVLVLHDLACAMNHADRVVVLDQGHIAADGPPHEALNEDVIARVWGVNGRWLGEPGFRALSLP